MLWHRLALQLGGGTVAELQRRMSSEEYTRWIAYFRIEPGEPFRTDARFAMLASTLANIWRSKNSRSYSLKDFMVFSNADKATAKAKEPKTTKEWKGLWSMMKLVFKPKG